MKTLKEYINESLLDDFDEIEKTVDDPREQVIQFLEDNYVWGCNIKPNTFKISKKPNRDGKYEVDVTSKFLPCLIIDSRYTQEHLTNDLFIFTSGNFSIRNSNKLKDLTGFAETFDGTINIIGCDNLTALEGLPKIINGEFKCVSCHNLKSLKGSPEKVGSSCVIKGNPKLTSLEGAPKEVINIFDFSDCVNIKSLKGAPKKVGIWYTNNLEAVKLPFDEDDVRKVCSVMSNVIIK
jgi:hypothetical protein